MPYFTKEQEEQAVALILEECNFRGGGDQSNNITDMSYVERDKEGYIIGLVDLGLKRVVRMTLNNDNNGSSERNQVITTSTTTAARHWNMPPAIGYLSRLRKLTVYHCKSLPREIIHLSESLEEIAFHFCEELDFNTLPPEFERLQQLTDFRIHGRTAIGTKAKYQRILPIHRLQSFSNLRYLYYRGGSFSTDNNSIDKEKQEINFKLPRVVETPVTPDANNFLIQDLLSDKILFRDSLEILEVEGGNLTEFTVAELFSKVLPQYPNLTRLILPNNNIRFLSPIIAQQSQSIPSTVRLRCFYLIGNPVLDKGTVSSHELSPSNSLLPLSPEQVNLLQILSLYDEITSLGHGITESGLCRTEMLLALDLNAAGKVLLSERFKPIPLSVWPIVLERANQRKGYYDSTNVLYHLLRYGPATGKRNAIPARKPASSFALSMSPTTAVNADDTMRGLNSMIGVSPIGQFLTSSTEMFPTVTRKRKISMP
mmetsp:Transcript_16732/g.38629  ORF Transcript_16732/g.38629 Transcript_16732/m.38629 type:complete len:484 (-) Transcript_16732:53-1504(-)